MKLFIDPDALKRHYAQSEPRLKALMNAWADGLNFYLATHPSVTPRVIKHFEPWMALSFSGRQHRRRYREGEPGPVAVFTAVPSDVGRFGE